MRGLLGFVLLFASVALAGPLQAATPPPAPVPGPHRTVGVGAIDVMGPYANASATNAGGPIAARLTTKLADSGCCDVVERDDLAQLVSEMDLAKSRVSAGNTAPVPGNMIPAQFLITGSVTAQSAADRGGGLTIGGGGSAVGFGGAQGELTIDLRLVDTRTGSVVSAFKVRRNVNAHNLSLTTNVGGTSIGSNGFFNTPLGKALDGALDDAVAQVVRTLAAQPWRGQVVKFDGATLYVNAGSEGGVAVGDRFEVDHVGESLTDPATGKVLMENMTALGVVTITNAQPKIAWGAFAARPAADAPVRGDFVVTPAP
jgi:curli biogenesis system outer membrane secretion channel CsgG